MPRLPPLPDATLASTRASSELELLREPLSAAARSAAEHVQLLESDGVFRYVGDRLVCVDVKRAPCEEDQLKELADCSQASRWPDDEPIFVMPSWFSEPPGLTLPLRSKADHWRNELLNRASDIENTPAQVVRFPCKGRSLSAERFAHGRSAL